MAEPPSRADIFLNHCPPGIRADFENTPDLPSLLDELLQSVDWPSDWVEDSEFLKYLASKLPTETDNLEALRSLCASDLYLACACARNIRAAQKTFEELLSRELGSVFARMRPPADHENDLRQKVLKKILVGEEDKPARIVQYAGQGELKAWLRVVAVRETLNFLRTLGREQPLDDDHLATAAQPNDDPEWAYIKQIYRQQFKLAFEQALEELSVRERNILRYYLLEGLNIEQIGAIYEVHRATVARWIAKIRGKLLAATRRLLMRELKVSQAEFDSIIRLIQSQLDVSVREYL